MRPAFLVLLLLAGCASAPTIPEGETYTSSMGAFECRGYPLGAHVDEALGPHGGTIRIRDGLREVRFDIEEFDPILEEPTLGFTRAALYEGYLQQNILPLIRSVSPDAELLEANFLTLEMPRSLAGLPVYQSAVLLAKQGAVRGQIQYTDGRFMYTMSHFAQASGDWSKDKQLEAAYKQLLVGLGRCHFPRVGEEPGD
ncbi:MAG: hypothetical protein AAF545_05930 [Pseudomonadota bacterium]